MMYKTRFKKYFGGGAVDPSGLAASAGSAAGAAAGAMANPAMAVAQLIQQGGTQLIQTIDTPNEYGHRSKWGMALEGSLNGGAFGLAGALIKSKRNDREEMEMKTMENIQKNQQEAARTAAIYNTNPDRFNGTGNTYYATGGFMKAKAVGGELRRLSSENTEVQGPSHEEGGVDLPNAQANLEGKETISNGYVFSKRLGFAQLHKPIAKAIGRIESKPQSPERVYSLQKLREQEQQLMQMQEYLRKSLNLQ